MNLKPYAIAAFCLFGTTAAADVYKCSFTQNGAGGWSGKTLMVQFDEAKNSAQVMHNQTMAVSKEWYPAKLNSADAKRAVVSWKIKLVKDRKGQQANLDYRLRLVKSSNRGVLTMRPETYANNFQTNGTCQKQ
ncbi:MAG: hypothetical protein JXQ85_06960 [Cognatishimia sp.]|uniref:hypothetical protein n=1 Tax=Cognatishimia sp. TaxID=2211648 RepID=UPI003B8C3DDB